MKFGIAELQLEVVAGHSKLEVSTDSSQEVSLSVAFRSTQPAAVGL